MSWRSYVRLVLVLLLFALPAHPQLGTPLSRCGPRPTTSDWPKNQLPADQVSLPTQNRQSVDVVRLQREAQELADLSASIRAYVGRANRGVLSKDLVDKLKRVERLSKQLRGELTR
jgi:hypothetical protein